MSTRRANDPPADVEPASPPVVEDFQRENERLRTDLRRSERDRARLQRTIDRLQGQLDAARRAGFRQAAPFARGTTRRAPRRPGRKAGAAYGRRGGRATPRRVDARHDAPLPSACPHCGGAVAETRVASQTQIDLPPVRPVVRAVAVHVGRCQQCHRRVQGRHPLQTSDALGAAAVQLGPAVVALSATLHVQLGVSFGRIATLFRTRFGLTVSRSTLVRALHKTARQAQPTYAALCATVRGSPVVVPDETGWKVAARLWWLWVFATPDTTVYAIQPGRGFAEAATVLGDDFAGILVRDGWAPYRRFTAATHQTCLAHLLRRARTLRLDSPRARFPAQMQAALQHVLTVRDRSHQGTASPHGLAVARGRVISQLGTLLAQPGRTPAIQRCAAHLTTEFAAIFSCLFDPTVDAINWRAEQALRPAVITRKMGGGGHRTPRGAATQQVLASVLRTADQRHLDGAALLVEMLQAPTPTVPLALQVSPR